MSTEMIAVHCGAGVHNNHSKYNKLCKRACRKGIEILHNGGTSLEAVKAAITVLEDDPTSNCGYGSNLTLDGTVEGDASIMCGKTLMYGGCGAVPHIKNPICLAHEICIKQLETQPFGLVPPSLLVSKGALRFGKSVGLKTSKRLISANALKQYRKYKDLVESDVRLDTVGAVCVDGEGHVAAGCSSGGILLKKSGRVGQAAVFGSGVWADSFNVDENGVAVCTSGCGEHLMRTLLAKSIGEDVRKSVGCPTMAFNQSIERNFLNSKFLTDIPQKLCGALVLHIDRKTEDISLLWGHSTETMSIGYMNLHDQNPKALISQLPQNISVGTKITVSGIYQKSRKT